MGNFPVLKIRSKNGSSLPQDTQIWLDDVRLDSVYRVTLQCDADHLNRAYLFMEVALDVEIPTEVTKVDGA